MVIGLVRCGIAFALYIHMSDKGIYTAVSGAIAQSTKLDTIANNMANVNTPAFKADKQVFREYLTSYEKMPEVIEAPKVPASINSFFPLNGGDKSYVDTAGTSTAHTQGSFKITNAPFDLAIEGDGYFEILTPQGVKWTRNGSFTRNSEGVLVTKQGYPVLLEDDGTPPQDRTITVGDAGKFSVNAQGEVFVNERLSGNISVKTVDEKDALQKDGVNFYKLRDNYSYKVDKPAFFKVHQAALEMSNVNVVNEMTEMIKTTRVFESLQKAIQAYDQMNGKLINDVSKMR